MRAFGAGAGHILVRIDPVLDRIDDFPDFPGIQVEFRKPEQPDQQVPDIRVVGIAVCQPVDVDLSGFVFNRDGEVAVREEQL